MRDKLPDDVREELDDPEYTTRKHYSRATYAVGCRGPLCKKAERDRGRRRTQIRAEDDGREYIPNHEIRLEDDELLDEILDWYLETRVTVAS